MRNNSRTTGGRLRPEQAAEQGGKASQDSESQIDRSLIDQLLAEVGNGSGDLGSAVVRTATLAAALHRSMVGEINR